MPQLIPDNITIRLHPILLCTNHRVLRTSACIVSKPAVYIGINRHNTYFVTHIYMTSKGWISSHFEKNSKESFSMICPEFPYCQRYFEKITRTVIPDLIVARLLGEGDYKVNHRGVHFGPYNCSQVMYGNNRHTISSATNQRMISTTWWICEIARNRGRVTYKCDIFTFRDTDSPYIRVTIRWGITVQPKTTWRYCWKLSTITPMN